MDPTENNIEYSQESQAQIDENNTLFDALQQQQREEEEAVAAQAAQEQAAVEAEPQTSEEAFQNPLGGLQDMAQQATDSSGQGLGQVFDAVGGLMDNALGGITEERSEERQGDRVAGKEGDDRNVVGALQGLVQKGLDLLPEEWTEDRGLDVGPTLEEGKENSMSESDRVMAGSVLGAAESVAEASEVIGDFTKTLASKANIIGYDAKDDPFSDQYNWASWNLGKDELGAQTPAGKIIQGFGEFGVTFMATGGGSAVANIGKGAKGAKAIVGAMGREALEGVATDMILAASGEGNLSNLIKENAPDWYPTWLTALALEEDDNPFEAAFKTALEGGMLGAPIGAVGAYLKGARAGRKAIEEGATQAEAGEAAIKTSQEALAEPAKTTRVGQVKDYEKFAGETAELATLRDMEEKGISATWDDVANVRGDLFIPGTRQIEAPEFNPAAMDAIMGLDPTDFDGGVTVNPFTGEQPSAGTMVAVDGASLDNLDDPEAVAGFISKYYDILTREDAYLGAWVSKETGKPVVEISRLVDNNDEAVALGKLFDQEGVFDLTGQTGDGGYTPTGGLDQLKTTKGAHLKSISTRPPEPKAVPAQTAAKQMVKGEQALSPQTGVQNVLTSQQVRRLATAGDERTGQILEEINAGMEIDISELADEANLSELDIVQDAATKLGDDFGFVAGDVSKLETNAEGFLTRTGIVQSRMVMKELSSRIAQTSFKVNDASARGMNEMEHMGEMISTLKTFMKTYKITANLNSKRLSAGAIELPPEFGVGAKQLKNLYGADAVEGLTKSFDQSAKMLDDLEKGLKGNDPKARRKALQIAHQLELVGDNPFKLAQNAGNMAHVGTKVGLKIMYNSMLSSPATHIVNGVSNFIATVMRPAAAAAGGDIKSKKAALASFHAIGETINDALEMAGKKWEQHDTNAKGAITNDGEASLMLDDLEARAEASGDATFQQGVSIMRTIDDVANFPLFDWPSRALTTADEFFKTAVQRMEYHRMMMEEAIDLGGNDVQAVFEDLIKKKKDLNFTKSGESLNKELNRLAKEVTFQTDLEGAAKSFGKAVDDFPVLKVFFPFVRTGHNVAKYTFSYVPVLAQAMERLDGGFDFAKLPPYEQAVIKGRQRIGTTFIAATGLMASQGLITGNGPMDPEARKRWLEQNQPRSIKLGDKFISIDRIEPFGPILSAVADIWYAYDNGDMKLDRAQWMAGYLAAAIGTNITDRTFFSGFQDFAKILNPRNAGSHLIGTGADTLNNFIPAAGMRRTLTNMLTPYMQEFNEVWDRTLYTSGIGAGLANHSTRYDFITGEAVSTTSGGINALLPIKFNQKKQDEVKQALFDIEFNSDQIVEELGRTGTKLSPEQISRLQQHMGNSDLHARLKEIVTAPDWKKAVQDYKDKLSKGGYRVSRTSQPFYTEIKDLITEYADHAMWELKQDYPELQESLDNYRQDLYTDKYGGLTEFYQQ